MTITTKSGRGEKVHILADGEYCATTNQTFWYSKGLPEGTEVSGEELEELLRKVSGNRLYEKALDLLSGRDYCRKELSDKLIRKVREKDRAAARDFGVTDASFSTEVLNAQKADAADRQKQVDAICDRLEEAGLLDDERYARTYAAELIRNKHVSSRGLMTALLQKGVPRETASLVVEEADIDPLSSVRTLLQTKYRTRDLSDEKQRRRTIAALQRLGYSYGDIVSAMDAPSDD